MKTISKSILSIAAALTVVGATLTPALVYAWGDSAGGRPSYTLEQIRHSVLGDKITFNSISDGKIGDEKNFVGAKLDGTTGSWNANEIKVEDGKTYNVRLYVHNNNPRGKNAIAQDVKVKFDIPTAVASSHTITGFLKASNANPDTYWDEVVMSADRDFYMEYVQGSAKFTNAKIGSVKLSDTVVSKDTLIGYEGLDGKIPGCYEYDGVVTLDVKIHYSDNSKLAKTVRAKGTKTWSESVNAKIGDEVEFQLAYTNLTAGTVKNVMIRDLLPANLQYVKNSTVLYNANHKNGLKINDDTVTTTGINIGDYATKGNAYVRFTAKVVDTTLTCGNNKLVNWASSTTNNKTVKDDASVVVAKTCEPTPEPTPTPKPTPEVIVETGASDIIVSALGLGSVVTALGFYIASTKKF